MRRYKNLFLTGIMGTGKSTIGKLLARQSGRKFVDLDEEIVKGEHKSINKIFAEIGESGFRELEKAYLKNLELNTPTVVATGGGCVIDKENRDFMKEKGAIIFINTAPEIISKRLEDDSSRPLLSEGSLLDKLIKLLNERKMYYNDYTFKLDANHLTPLQASKEIIKMIR